jgi:uncharacterized coiled-coil protein SlyX
MNKILIDTLTLKALLVQHPQVEIELLAVAREKLAEELKRKMPEGYVQKMAEKAIEDIKEAINDQTLDWRKTSLSDNAKALLIAYVNETCIAQAKKLADDTVRVELEKLIKAAMPKLEARLAQHQEALLQKINGFIGEQVNKKIQERLDAMSKLTAGLGG